MHTCDWYSMPKKGKMHRLCAWLQQRSLQCCTSREHVRVHGDKCTSSIIKMSSIALSRRQLHSHYVSQDGCVQGTNCGTHVPYKALRHAMWKSSRWLLCDLRSPTCLQDCWRELTAPELSLRWWSTGPGPWWSMQMSLPSFGFWNLSWKRCENHAPGRCAYMYRWRAEAKWNYAFLEDGIDHQQKDTTGQPATMHSMPDDVRNFPFHPVRGFCQCQRKHFWTMNHLVWSTTSVHQHGRINGQYQ